ncbi:MAG: hypothetical protein ACYTEQ_01535 [Planctomycetota bacterium]|jgi:hypothetical protein
MEIQEGPRVGPEEEVVEQTVSTEESQAAQDATPEGEPVKKDELTPEALATSESEGEAGVTPEGEPVEEPVTPYTPEEIEQLLQSEDDASVDLRRLSPEGQAIFKSVDRGLKPKLRERAELKKRLDAIEQQASGRQEPAQPTIEEEFNKNPELVLTNLRALIAEKERTDPFGEDLVQLRNAHGHYLERLVVEQRQQSVQERAISEAREAVREVIPEYDARVDQLNEFAYGLGFTPEQVAYMTNPMEVGQETAVTVAKVINHFYEMSSAKDTLSSKEVKAPTSVEAAGGGIPAKPKSDEWSTDDYLTERNRQTLT